MRSSEILLSFQGSESYAMNFQRKPRGSFSMRLPSAARNLAGRREPKGGLMSSDDEAECPPRYRYFVAVTIILRIADFTVSPCFEKHSLLSFSMIIT